MGFPVWAWHIVCYEQISLSQCSVCAAIVFGKSQLLAWLSFTIIFCDNYFICWQIEIIASVGTAYPCGGYYLFLRNGETKTFKNILPAIYTLSLNLRVCQQQNTFVRDKLLIFTHRPPHLLMALLLYKIIVPQYIANIISIATFKLEQFEIFNSKNQLQSHWPNRVLSTNVPKWRS